MLSLRAVVRSLQFKDSLVLPVLSFPISHGLNFSRRNNYDKVITRGMAGHSHWQNIKGIKSANDAAYNKLTEKHVRDMRIVIQESGGQTDPKLNKRLGDMIKRGKKLNITLTTMERVMKSYDKVRDGGTKIKVEANGPGFCGIIVELHTNRVKHVRDQVAHRLKKFGATLAKEGQIKDRFFDLKGVILTSVEEGQTIDIDAATDTAIESEAEDVIEVIDSNTGLPGLQFYCDPSQLHVVRDNLENAGCTITDCNLGYRAHTFVPLEAPQLKLTSDLIEMLEEIEETTQVYNNAEPAS